MSLYVGRHQPPYNLMLVLSTRSLKVRTPDQGVRHLKAPTLDVFMSIDQPGPIYRHVHSQTKNLDIENWILIIGITRN